MAGFIDDGRPIVVIGIGAVAIGRRRNRAADDGAADESGAEAPPEPPAPHRHDVGSGRIPDRERVGQGHCGRHMGRSGRTRCQHGGDRHVQHSLGHQLSPVFCHPADRNGIPRRPFRNLSQIWDGNATGVTRYAPALMELWLASRTARKPAHDQGQGQGPASRIDDVILGSSSAKLTVRSTPTRRKCPVLAPVPSMTARAAMYNGNALKIGLFGANCSSGRAVTLVPERWSGSWADNVKLARMADDAGIDFLLPIGRWKGYGGDTDYQGVTFETVTWACGLLALTRRITVFGTVHAPLFNPLIAAKEFVTADHIGEGRFGLNVVVGWNEGEFEMFGVSQREHAARYAFAQEWLDAVKQAWSAPGDFDFDGKFLKLKGVRAFPKPYGETRPIIMNAGSSATGQ